VGHLVGGVIDEDIEPPEIAEPAIDELPAMSRVLHVAGHHDRAAAGLLDPARRLLCVVVLAKVRNQHIRTLSREGYGYRAPDP
jgi:hypothetical protein